MFLEDQEKYRLLDAMMREDEENTEKLGVTSGRKQVNVRVNLVM